MDEFESEAELEVATEKGIAYLYLKNLYENKSIQNVSIIKDKSIDIEQAKEFLLSTIGEDNIKKVVIIQDRFNDVNQAKLFLESILNETKINDVIIKSDDPKTYLKDILNNKGINTVNIISNEDELKKAKNYLNNVIDNNLINSILIIDTPLTNNPFSNPNNSSTLMDTENLLDAPNNFNFSNQYFPNNPFSSFIPFEPTSTFIPNPIPLTDVFGGPLPSVPGLNPFVVNTLAYENPGDLSWDISDDILDKYIY